ncbi:MAG: response regulator transcription factor [Acidimicrobiales bacterium]
MRLLIVEDDDDIAIVIEQTLRADGYDVDRSPDGPDGLWRAEEGDYGLIILDVLLPGMNGFKVCENLRTKGITTPVLMLTAKVGDYDETDGLDSGADDYLRKPFSPNVLQARVRALLRRGQPAVVSDTLERGGVSLQPNSRTCTFNGEDVVLTARQAQVLETLLRAGDNPVSRLDLVRAVWGMDFDGDPNVADVYIGYLRNKLHKATIENVRGLGFRVRA